MQVKCHIKYTYYTQYTAVLIGHLKILLEGPLIWYSNTLDTTVEQSTASYIAVCTSTGSHASPLALPGGLSWCMYPYANSYGDGKDTADPTFATESVFAGG